MHKQHHSEDKENHVELQVINEVQSGAACKKSTASNSVINANGHPHQEMSSNDKTSNVFYHKFHGGFELYFLFINIDRHYCNSCIHDDFR